MHEKSIPLSFAAATLLLAACQDASGPSQTATPRASSAAVAAAGGDERIPGQYIVVVRSDVSDVPGLARRLTAASHGSLKHVYGTALRGFALRVPNDAAMASIRANPAVAYVEQDQRVHLVATTQAGATWGLDRIDQRDLPLSTTYSYEATGAGVHAYVIDQELYAEHADFGGRASRGYDGVGGAACTTADDAGHATHVGGTIGGASWGVAKGVALVGVRVLDCGGSGTVSGVIAGVDWVTSNAVKPAVANMSLGGGTSDALDNAVRNSISSGVTYALAAGNGNFLGWAQDACTTSPARVTAAITVSATNSSDTKASWANYGTCVDIFAPGVSITSAWVGGPTATNTISGTSMATPHVAGAAALYLESNPSASPGDVASALTGSATTGKVSSAGSGSPNRLLYVAATTGGTPSDAPPVASFTYSCSGFTCTFDGSGSSDDKGIATYSWAFSGGSPSTASGPSASSTFSRRSQPTVTLTVTDSGNQSTSTSRTLNCNRTRCQ